MKKVTILFTIIVAAISFVSCEPVENRQEMTGAVTDAEINQYVSVTTEMRDGKRSNYLIFKSEGLKALTSFQHGLGTYVGTNARVQSFVVSGEQEVILTVLNRDGSKVTKTYPVTVDECFDVAQEWELFCGTGSKIWTWDDKVSAPYGMGDALWSGHADWWAPSISNNIEGPGATMTFSAIGAALTKNKTDGTQEKGIFGFDMSKRAPNYSRSLGQLTTSIPVLVGQTTGEDTGIGTSGKDVRVYEIITLTDDELMLSWLESSAKPDVEGWGQATLWFFRAK